MSKLNGRTVIRGRLHSPLFIGGLGNISQTLDSNSAKIMGSLKLTKVEGGVLGEVKSTAFFVPDSGFVSLELGPYIEETTEKSTTKK